MALERAPICGNALSLEYDRPGPLLSGDAKEVLQYACAGPRVASLLTAFPAAPAAIRPPAVRRDVFKTNAAVTPTSLHFPANLTRNPPDLDVVRP